MTSCKHADRMTMGMRWPVRSMKMPALICETMATACVPSGYVVMADWEKRLAWYLSQRRNMPFGDVSVG